MPGAGLELLELVEFRILVDAIHAELSSADHPLSDQTTENILRHHLIDPIAHRVLDEVQGGTDGVVRQACHEVESFSPSATSNAQAPETLVRILLLQQIDLAWWSAAGDFQTTDVIGESNALVDLVTARRDGSLRFEFSIASDNIMRRARNFAVRRIFPNKEPKTAGLSCTSIRPEMIIILNSLADSFAAAAPSGTPPLWINSVVRSVTQQRRLRELGYSALLPSAHCRGWAADVEMDWLARFGAQEVLQEILIDHRDRGLLNVIDEGSAWHICPSPRYVDAVVNGSNV
jgi:hypothetical protein